VCDFLSQYGYLSLNVCVSLSLVWTRPIVGAEPSVRLRSVPLAA